LWITIVRPATINLCRRQKYGGNRPASDSPGVGAAGDIFVTAGDGRSAGAGATSGGAVPDSKKTIGIGADTNPNAGRGGE
jgi:hypothetical protein